MKNLVKNILTKAIITAAAIFVIGTVTGTESEAAGSKKTDPRKANYVATNPDYKEITFEWTGYDGSELSLKYSIDESAYEYYASLDRYWAHADYEKYMTDAYNHAIIEQIVDSFERHQEKYGYSDADLLQNMTNFVQEAITYQYDIDGTGMSEYPKFPIETLFSKRGDCEDTSILLAAMMKEAGIGSCLLVYESHMAVGFSGTAAWQKPRYETENGYFYFIETTGFGWKIGDMPEQYLREPATIYFMH